MSNQGSAKAPGISFPPPRACRRWRRKAGSKWIQEGAVEEQRREGRGSLEKKGPEPICSAALVVSPRARTTLRSAIMHATGATHRVLTVSQVTRPLQDVERQPTKRNGIIAAAEKGAPLRTATASDFSLSTLRIPERLSRNAVTSNRICCRDANDTTTTFGRKSVGQKEVGG